MELHFYPGQKLLIAKDGGKVLGRFEAWGGPPSMGNDPRMAEEPTWPGDYIINKAHPYRTSTWQLSRIKWGTELKDQPAKNDVWYKMGNGKWASIKKDHHIPRVEIIRLYSSLYKVKAVPKTWVFNDFGPISIRWFKDLNKNKKLDKNEHLSGQMFHTTAENEAEKSLGEPLKMTLSHGCIHLRPAQRDKMLKMGAFKAGTPFTVHEYDERF